MNLPQSNPDLYQHVVITPGGFEKYLEEIGGYSPAADTAKIIEIASRYGIPFYL